VKYLLPTELKTQNISLCDSNVALWIVANTLHSVAHFPLQPSQLSFSDTGYSPDLSSDCWTPSTVWMSCLNHEFTEQNVFNQLFAKI